MSYVEFIAAATVAIFAVLAILRQAFPWLANGGSRYIPLFALALGVGVAVYCGYHYDGLNWLEVLISAILPALGSSGIHSQVNNFKP